MREEEGQMEALKAQEKRSAELQKQGYSPRHSANVAKREHPTPAQKRAARKETNKREIRDM